MSEICIKRFKTQISLPKNKARNQRLMPVSRELNMNHPMKSQQKGRSNTETNWKSQKFFLKQPSQKGWNMLPIELREQEKLFQFFPNSAFLLSHTISTLHVRVHIDSNSISIFFSQLVSISNRKSLTNSNFVWKQARQKNNNNEIILRRVVGRIGKKKSASTCDRHPFSCHVPSF